MRDRPSEPNPYASSPPEVGEARKRFRWRVIPVTLLCVFGASAFAGMVVRLGVDGWWRFARPDAVEVGVGPPVPMLVGDLFGVIAAVLHFVTARRLWQGRWWSAGAAFSVALVLAFLFARLSGLEQP